MKKGWTGKTIADVCDVVNGGTPKTGVARYWGGAHRWITPAEMGRRTSPYVEETDRTLSDAGLANSSANLVPALSVILSSRAPIGHLVINTEPMAFNQGCKGLAPKKDLDHKFLYYYLTSIVAQLNALGTGATFKELSGTKLKSVSIPVPPLPEQRRIVGILDEAFDGIATAKANAEKNLQNARAVFKSHLNAVFTERGEGWVEKPLGQCVEAVSTGPFGSLLHKADYESGGIPLVNPVNIEGDKIVPKDGMAVGTATAKRLTKYALREDDIVIARRGEIGRCAVVQPEQVGWLCGTGSFVIRPSRQTDSCFLAHLLRSGPYRRRLESVASRATMPSISNNDLSSLVVRLPPLSVQQQACACLQQLSSETLDLESIYQRKLAGLDELKKSLLDQAFSGDL